MCTITVSYDSQNELAAKFIELMRLSGMFTITEDNMTEDEEKEAFLYTSRINAAKMFTKYL